jgi:hypothetical protein
MFALAGTIPMNNETLKDIAFTDTIDMCKQNEKGWKFEEENKVPSP